MYYLERKNRFLPDINYLAKANWRNANAIFGIKEKDRFFHKYILGQTGTGKTTLLQTMILQDVYVGNGLCLIDPHGDLVERVFQSIPSYRQKDLVYFNVTHPDMPFRFNPLLHVDAEQRPLIASSFLEILKKLWESAWGLRLEHILRYIILTLLEQPKESKTTLANIIDILHDKDFRAKCVQNIQNKYIRAFWENEFPKYSKNDMLPILNKVGAFVLHPALQRALISNPQDIDIREIMDNKKILLINISKGVIGEDISHIIGSIFVTAIASAAFTRVDTPEEKRLPFLVYLDEFQNFTNLSLVTMLSELRKFKIGMTLAHQYLQQLDEHIRFAVLGNVGTLVTFRVGTEDAPFLEKMMYPKFAVDDLINLPNYHIYLKLMIDGKPSKPFSATTLSPKDLKPVLYHLDKSAKSGFFSN
jgi:type IV secretory pathway TraG/TraD family ATPase VirD4